MTPVLEVLTPGALATVQDDGRPGAARHGVPRGGAMDRFALRAANRLLGNPPGAAAVEVTAGGAAFVVLAPTLVAITGADLSATLDAMPLAPWTAVMARRGAVLAMPTRRGAWGARAYLAISGGIDVAPVLGSRSTHLAGAFGGLAGRALRPGDQLGASAGGAEPLVAAGRTWPETLRPPYGPEPLLRVVPGPHSELFAADALAGLAAAPLRVSDNSNRMGYRLEGGRAPHLRTVSLPSLGVFPGVIQVPPDGAPILLMADAQTTGGYPIIGVVASADLPLAAQLLPGDQLRFAVSSRDEALGARRRLVTWEMTPFPGDELVEQLGLAGAHPEFP